MSFNILNDVTLYKLSNPKNKMLDLNLTKEEEEEEANRPRPRPRPFLPIPQGKKKKKKEEEERGTETLSLSFPLSLFLLDPIGRLNILVQLIEKLNERKRTTSTGPIPPLAVDI